MLKAEEMTLQRRVNDKTKQDSLDGANAGVNVCSPVPDLNRQFKQTVNASLGASILKMIFLIFLLVYVDPNRKMTRL